MALLILNFSAEVESSKPWPHRLPIQETNPGPTAQEAGRADSRCGRFAEERNLIPLPGVNLCTYLRHDQAAVSDTGGVMLFLFYCHILGSLFCASDPAFRKVQTAARRRPEDKCKVEGKVTRVHTIEGEQRCFSTHSLICYTRWRRLVSFTPRLFSRGERTSCTN